VRVQMTRMFCGADPVCFTDSEEAFQIAARRLATDYTVVGVLGKWWGLVLCLLWSTYEAAAGGGSIFLRSPGLVVDDGICLWPSLQRTGP
jgi:hypothetical protein